MRLSDLEPRFICSACGKRGAERAVGLQLQKTPVGMSAPAFCALMRFSFGSSLPSRSPRRCDVGARMRNLAPTTAELPAATSRAGTTSDAGVFSDS
jgi:hypothetical protein